MDNLSQEKWEKHVIQTNERNGWCLERNCERYLCFFSPGIDQEVRWQREFDKKTRRFIQYNANQKVSLMKPKINGDE